jgi:hypothetical protein
MTIDIICAYNSQYVIFLPNASKRYIQQLLRIQCPIFSRPGSADLTVIEQSGEDVVGSDSNPRGIYAKHVTIYIEFSGKSKCLPFGRSTRKFFGPNPFGAV